MTTERTKNTPRKTVGELIKQAEVINRHAPIAAQYAQAMQIKDELAALPEANGRYRSDVQRAVQAVQAIEREYALRTALGSVDKEALQNDRNVYGAKGANLISVSTFLAKFAQTKLREIALHIKIPEFELVPASLYVDWKMGKDITPALQELFTQVKQWGGSIAVRSSAVYTEDGEETTGAGIYDSKFTPRHKDATYKDFETAVYAVYASCESSRAQEYRAENGITEKEKMGLVIQKAIEDGQKGYGNSTRPYTQTLLDIHLERDKKSTVVLPYKKAKVTDRIFSEDTTKFFSKDRYIELDNTILGVEVEKSIITIEALSIPLIVALEWYYGHPIQIEYICDSNMASLQIVQVRPLPAKMFTGRKIEFPEDTDYIAEFDALGCCDEVLPVLYEHNVSQKEGIVIRHSFDTSHDMHRRLPKKGVVVFPERSADNCGHLETLAMEKGLVIVYCERGENVEKNTAYARLSVAITQAKNAQIKADQARKKADPKNYTYTESRAFLRAVANGERIRFYNVPQQAGIDLSPSRL